MEGIENVLAYFDMIDREDREIPDARIYERSRWIRAPRGNAGFFFPTAELGDLVREGEVLGKIVDPFTNQSFDISTPVDGEIIGMSVSQPVLSGYALFHVAWHDES